MVLRASGLRSPNFDHLVPREMESAKQQTEKLFEQTHAPEQARQRIELCLLSSICCRRVPPSLWCTKMMYTKGRIMLDISGAELCELPV